jgi:hypothetical protein
VGKSLDWYWSLDCDLDGRLRDCGVSNVADQAMLFVIGLGVPMAGRVRAQPEDCKGKRDGQESYG